MSLTGPSRAGAFGAFFLFLVVAALGAIYFALDRFHAETRRLTDAVRELAKRPTLDGADLVAEIAALREALAKEGASGLSASELAGLVEAIRRGGGANPIPARIPAVHDDGTEKPVGSAPAKTKRYPIGGAVMNYSEEPSTYNRWTSNEGAIRQILNYVHDGLFGLSPNLEVRPALATHWEVSDDKLRYTFHLRKGVRFSDGTPFTSEDVAFTLRLIQNELVNSDYYRESYIDVERVETPDPLTVVFHYKRKYWRGLYAIGLNLKVGSSAWIRNEMERIAKEDPKKFPPGSYSLDPENEKFGALYNEVRAPMVGTGPYRFNPSRSLVTGQHITLYRNSSSWWMRAYPGKWNISAMRWRFISQDVVLWEEVKKQKIDAKVVDPDIWYDSLQYDKAITDNFNFYQYDHVGLGHSIIFWNCRRSKLGDKRVRQALAHCIDRKTMLEVFKKGIGEYATCVFKPIYPEYSHDLEPRMLDLAKARSLLDASGWRDTNGDGIRDKDGADLRISMLLPQGREEFRRFSQLWQSDMKKAGVDMEIRQLEWGAFIKMFYDHDFDGAYLYNSHTDPWIEPYEDFLSTKTGKGEPNHSGWKNLEVDRILEAARPEFDRQKRIELFHRFNHIVWEEVPILPLLHGKVCVVGHKRFANVEIFKAGMRQEDWYVPVDKRMYDDDGNRLR